MAGIVLWRQKNLTTEKFNHKGHEGTRSRYSVVNYCVLLPQRATLVDWEEKSTKDTKEHEDVAPFEAATPS
jgi:hypothetical protein